jgi:hypothetical protein
MGEWARPRHPKGGRQASQGERVDGRRAGVRSQERVGSREGQQPLSSLLAPAGEGEPPTQPQAEAKRKQGGQRGSGPPNAS